MRKCEHPRNKNAEPCTQNAAGDGPFCETHGCWLCGGVMLADTEEWALHWCAPCLDYEWWYRNLVGPLESIVQELDPHTQQPAKRLQDIVETLKAAQALMLEDEGIF